MTCILRSLFHSGIAPENNDVRQGDLLAAGLLIARMQTAGRLAAQLPVAAVLAGGQFAPGLFDGLLACGLATVEVASDGFKPLEDLGELLWIVYGPVLLGREANTRAIGAPAIVCAAERNG